MIKMIWAQEKSGGIGYQNKLPWSLPQEMRFFRQTTLNQVVVMGYGTFLSLTHPLPQRVNIVLSSQHCSSSVDGFHFCQCIDQICRLFSHSDLYIIGGKKTYIAFLKYAEELIISKIDQSFVCDVYMDIDISDFALVKTQKHDGFRVEYYRRKGT